MTKELGLLTDDSRLPDCVFDSRLWAHDFGLMTLDLRGALPQELAKDILEAIRSRLLGRRDCSQSRASTEGERWCF